MLFKKKKTTNNQTDKRHTARQPATSSQRVNSYYTASKKQITTFQRHTEASGNRKKPFVERLKKYSFIMLTIGLVFVAMVWMFTLSKTASISIEGGGAYRATNEYQQVVADALSASVQNTLKLSLRADEIEKAIKEQLPEAYTVAVYAPLFGRSPEVIITTAAPFATVVQGTSQSIVMSERGRLVQDISRTPIDASKLPTITNKSGTTFQAGDQLFKPEEMAALRGLQFQYTKGNSQVAPVAYILPSAPREIHVQEGSYLAKFSMQQDSPIEQQFGALRAVQSQLQQQGRTPAEYIDVRLASKVFIK